MGAGYLRFKRVISEKVHCCCCLSSVVKCKHSKQHDALEYASLLAHHSSPTLNNGAMTVLARYLQS